MNIASLKKIKASIVLVLSFIMLLLQANGQQIPVNKNVEKMHSKTLTYLALGDSYTIGEAVPIGESFPYQTTRLLRQKGFDFTNPEIVATTGWTTSELAAAIDKHNFLKSYDVVSLLIGVNNQYRGLSLEAYKIEFESLLRRAISFAGNDTKKVFVLSIPDYGATPFARDRNPQKIATEIDAFNGAAQAACKKQGVVFINITKDSKAALHNTALVAADGLHPSGLEYSKWAEKLAASVLAGLK